MRVCVLVLVLLAAACTETKRVRRVVMRVHVDTIYVAISMDGYMCRAQQGTVPGDAVSCFWTAQ